MVLIKNSEFWSSRDSEFLRLRYPSWNLKSGKISDKDIRSSESQFAWAIKIKESLSGSRRVIFKLLE